MGAMAQKEAAARANQAAARNQASALRSYGLNQFERNERQRILTTQTHTAAMSEKMKMMYSSSKAVGAAKARAAGAGRSTGDQGVQQAIAALQGVFDFEGRVLGQNIADQTLKLDSQMRKENILSSETLTQQLNNAESMKRDESGAFLSGLFSDVGMVVGMGTGIAGAVGSFR